MEENKFENDYVIGQKNANYNQVMDRIEELNRLVLINKEWKKNIYKADTLMIIKSIK